MNNLPFQKEKQAINEFKKVLFQELGKHISGKKITQQYNYSFKVLKPSLVAIFVSARCKSRKQLNSNIDEDLRAEINGLQFREIPPEKKVQLFDIPASWNGSKLKGLKKTNVFLMVLSKGEHIISLIPEENTSALVEDIKVKELSSTQNPTFNLEEQAEDGDRRPWYTFALTNLPLKTITAKITTKYRWRDSDDVKLIINGKIRINILTIFHRYWFWAGSLVKKLLRKETKEHSFKVDLDQGETHYIEFWADKTPILHKVTFNLGEISFYSQAKVVWQEVNLREKPDSQSESLAILKKDEKVEVLKKIVEGEAPYAKEDIEEEKRNWCNIWHKVKFKEKEGYIFSKALEIEGEDRESVIQKIVVKAKELSFEIPLAWAIAQAESQFFPYAVSRKEAKGLFQFRKIAQDEIKEEFNITNVFDINQNTEAGLRYFLKLKNHYYKNDPENELKAIAAYRAGLTNIKAGIPLNKQRLSGTTKWYLKEVQKARKEFLKEYQGGKINLKILMAFLGVVIMVGFAFAVFFQGLPFAQTEIETIQRQPTDEFGKVEKTLIVDIDEDKVLDEVLFKENRERVRGLSLINVDVFFNGKFIHNASGEFDKAFIIDFEQDGKKEVILQTITGQIGRTRIYYYQDNTLKVAKDIFAGFDNLEDESGIYFVDENNNGRIDHIVLYNFDRPSDCLANSAEIYQYHQGQLVKFMEAKVDPDWCKFPY